MDNHRTLCVINLIYIKIESTVYTTVCLLKFKLANDNNFFVLTGSSSGRLKNWLKVKICYTGR
jgi:hypothetical protein